MSKEYKFLISYKGGTADEHKLDLYDAAKSIKGLARALAISTHAMASNGEIRHRVESIPGVEFYLHPGRKGSLVEMVSVIFSDPIAQSVGTSVLGAAFWDMINFSWRHATGSEPEPEHTRNRKIVRDKEEFANEIADVLEGPMQDLHAPIKGDGRVSIQIKRPRGEVVLELNTDTYNYVSTINDGGIRTNIPGNVTKYNIVSGYGRFYDEGEGRTVPFNLSKDMTTAKKGLLTTSLHNSGQRAEGEILIDAKVILTRTEQVKRYIIIDARPV